MHPLACVYYSRTASLQKKKNITHAFQKCSRSHVCLSIWKSRIFLTSVVAHMSFHLFAYLWEVIKWTQKSSTHHMVSWAHLCKLRAHQITPQTNSLGCMVVFVYSCKFVVYKFEYISICVHALECMPVYVPIIWIQHMLHTHTNLLQAFSKSYVFVPEYFKLLCKPGWTRQNQFLKTEYSHRNRYGLATMNRLFKFLGLSCKRSLFLWGTYVKTTQLSMESIIWCYPIYGSES